MSARTIETVTTLDIEHDVAFGPPNAIRAVVAAVQSADLSEHLTGHALPADAKAVSIVCLLQSFGGTWDDLEWLVSAGYLHANDRVYWRTS